MYNQGNFSSSSQFRPNNPQQSSMQPPSHQGGGGGAPPPLQPHQFPSAPAPLAVQHGGPMYYHGPPPPPGPPFPPRLAPILSSHGQMLYSTATQFHPPLPPQHGQFLPPPPQSLPYSGFVPVTSSYVHSSYENPFETVSLPKSSLPPPQPPLPHDSTSNISASSDGRNAEDGNRCVKGDTGEDSEVEGILPPPPRKPAELEIVKNIEVLCNHIAKSENGPALEVRVKESGNPKFAFLFGGESGSEAAIAHEYFLWMKSKCCINLSLDRQPKKTISLPAPFEIEDASHSAQDSDMEMEDDMNQSDKDQGVSNSVEGLKEHVFKSNEISFVKEQSPEHPHLIFSPSVNPTSGLLPGSKASVVAADEKEQHECVLERPSTEDDSSASGGLRYTYQKRKRVVPLTGLASVPHADAFVSGEEASGALIKIQSPLFRRFQEYASDDSAEDNDGMPYEDMSPVMVSPLITASKTSSHEDEMTILYADVGCENISAKEEVIMPSAESGSIQPIDPLSRKPNISQDSLEVIEASDMANDSLDTTVRHQDNYSGDQTSCSLTFKDDIQGDAGIGGHSDRLRKQSTEKCFTSKKVDQFGRLVREDASESDSDGARYNRRRARRGRSRSRSRNRSWSKSRSRSRSRSRRRSRSPHSRRRRKSRSPRRRKDRRNRSRSWTPKRQRSRSRSPNFRHKGENDRDKRHDNWGQIPDCMDFLRGRCFRGASCKYLHHTSTSGDPVKDNKSRNQEYLEPPQDPKYSDVNGVSRILMNTNVGNTNPLSQVSLEHGTFLKEQFKNQEMLPYSSVDMRKDCRLSVNKNSGSIMDDGRRGTASGSAQSATGVNRSDSEAAITGVIVQLAPQEELGVQLKENEICRQPPETLPSEVLPVQLKVVSEAQHLTGVVSQTEPSSFPNNVQQPQTKIPSSQSSLVDVSVLPSQPIPQPFCVHPSNQYPIPTSMSHTQAHHVTATSSFPLQNVAPQPTESREFQQPNFPSSGFHSYAFPLPRPPAFPQDVNAAYMSMPPTANIHGQLAPTERLPLYQAPFQDQHSQFPVPPQQTWAPLPPASNSAFQNPAFHLQFLQQPMQPGNEFFRPVMRPYSHEVPYNNMSQLSVAGASKLHHNPYASTFEQTPGNSRFSSVLRQDMEPNYRSNNDSLGSNASISGQGIGAFDYKLTDIPLDSSRSGGQVLGNENLPLFESVESSSTTLGKLGNTGRQAVEGATAANMSPGDGEFGDTAIDAEVGAVENGSPHLAEEGNWSPENPADAGNTASGDDEIGQVETSGKSKDSRSMKHFRAALVDFVKEVLKPSWRQGNMSKEAFKTIVKKTVDKVSGAMKKHQIPKSQAKINQYVESSQRKLTKLVMGYVDKYVKV